MTPRRASLIALIVVGCGAAAMLLVALRGAGGSAPGQAPNGSVGSSASRGRLDPSTTFYAARANPDAERQVEQLHAAGHDEDADLIARMIKIPTATWLTGGGPSDVRGQVEEIVARARGEGSVPVIVLYNVPGRDCSGASAGGAPSGEAYRSWVAAVADGLGETPAVLIVEPDGLALLPSDCGKADPFGRITLIHDAARTLSGDPNARVYLDAGHSRWHTTGDMATRLAQAGVTEFDGFFENVSNYQPTDQAVAWGHWVSRCIWFGIKVRPGAFGSCPSQYDSVNPDDPAGWRVIDSLFDDLVGRVAPDQLPHAVIDTSRNGQGRWTPPAGSFPDPQDWCNPPGRGLGARPTVATRDPLVDAFVWIKVPGESDGPCLRGTDGPADPARRTVDPPAGEWFPDFAIELARGAVPPL
jgi:endoglucanase